MKKISFLFVIIIGIFQDINAQNIINVDKAIEITMKNNLQIQSNNMNIKSVQNLSKATFDLPKTDINFQYGNNGGFEYNDAFQISQNFPFPTIFKIKKNLAKEHIKSQQLTKAITENDLRKQVRTYYYQLEYLEHNSHVLKRLDSIYSEFINIAELRYKTGDIGKLDLRTAITKKDEINLLFQQNEIFRLNTYINLKNIMCTYEDFIIETKSEYEPLLLTTLDISETENNPSIKLLYQEAKIAEQNKKLEKANNLPDFTLGYNNVSSVGMHTKNGTERFYDRSQRFSSIDIGISIPLNFGVTKAKIRSLDYEKQSLELNAKWQQKQLKTEFANALKQYEYYISQLKYFKEQALPNADEIINSAELEYKTGEISLVEYFFALQTAVDIQLNYLKNIQQINEIVTHINSLISK